MIRLLAAVLLLGGMAACNGSSRAAASASGEPAQHEPAGRALAGREPRSSQLHRATLTIEGMICPRCAEAVKQALEKTAGVVSAEADFQSETATVSFEPSKTNVDALAATIESVDRDPAPAFRVTARSAASR
ncbi:MAG: heavy-metal-associated domain-containing protein [Nannocystaceae bacterium]|nr:cation transporter [bacterium]